MLTSCICEPDSRLLRPHFCSRTILALHSSVSAHDSARAVAPKLGEDLCRQYGDEEEAPDVQKKRGKWDV